MIGVRDHLIDLHCACASYEEAAEVAGLEPVDHGSR